MENYQKLLGDLLQQEEALQFARFTNEMALDLGLRLIEAAKRDGKAITASISRNGQVLFHCAMTGTSPDNAESIRRKSNVVNRYGHSSFYVGTEYKSRSAAFDDLASIEHKDFAAYGGAFPLIVRQVGTVGVIAVSGLPQAEDHALVVAELKAYLASMD